MTTVSVCGWLPAEPNRPCRETAVRRPTDERGRHLGAVLRPFFFILDGDVADDAGAHAAVLPFCQSTSPPPARFSVRPRMNSRSEGG